MTAVVSVPNISEVRLRLLRVVKWAMGVRQAKASRMQELLRKGSEHICRSRLYGNVHTRLCDPICGGRLTLVARRPGISSRCC